MSDAPISHDPLHEVADLLGKSFPGHTMQRLRTPDGKYRYTYVSSGIAQSLDLDPVDLMQRAEVDHSWLHPDDKERFIGALEHSAATLDQLDIEVRVARQGGGYSWVRSIGHPRRLEDGSTLWDGVALDVTDRRQALEALERTLKQVRENETSEGRFSYIAASDVRDRLGDLRRAIGALGSSPADEATRQAIAEVEKRFEQFELALTAARDLVQVKGARTAAGPGLDLEMADGIKLTKRQRQIMDQVADGAANRDISDALGISEGTVKLHLSAIFKRMKVQNRTEAALKWRGASV